jgi:hypothetical protein
MQRVCPNPKLWNEVFGRLSRYADSHACTPARPPIPLVLAAWWVTNDREKMRRWEETVAWARANGCGGIVEEIADADFYKVNSPSGAYR